jgi:hypothetical protein
MPVQISPCECKLLPGAELPKVAACIASPTGMQLCPNTVLVAGKESRSHLGRERRRSLGSNTNWSILGGLATLSLGGSCVGSGCSFPFGETFLRRKPSGGCCQLVSAPSRKSTHWFVTSYSSLDFVLYREMVRLWEHIVKIG